MGLSRYHLKSWNMDAARILCKKLKFTMQTFANFAMTDEKILRKAANLFLQYLAE